MVEVIPAILEKDFSEIEKKIHLVSGLVEWVQIDIADETLVPNRTFLDPEPFKFLMGSVPRTSGSGETFFGDVRRPLSNVAGLDSSSLNEDLPPEGRKDLKVTERQVFNSPQKAHPSPEVSTLHVDHPLNFELHMMVKDPLMYLERFASVGFKRFFAHVEGDYVDEYIAKCYQLGVEVGLAIDGPTPFEKIHQYLDNLDVVLVMAIEAGESGRPFREDTVEKIKRIREIDLEIPIAVDGAMNDVNAEKVVAAGATRINSNSFIFDAPNVKMAIEKLKTLNPKHEILGMEMRS